MTTTPPRTSQARRWTSLALAGTAIGFVAAPLQAQDFNAQTGGPDRIWLAQAEGGEGGEGGEAGAVAEKENDAAYVAALGFVEGHLRVGVALYEADLPDMAITHMKHPQDEIYTALAPQLAERGAEAFDTQLTALALAVEGGASVEDVQAAFAAVLHEVEEASTATTEKAQLEALVIMTRTAAEEFSIGVVDGAIANLHEYQDAFGFLQTVRTRAATLAMSSDASVAAAAAKVTAAVDATDAAFAGLDPQGAVPGTADILFGAAAQMEFAVLSVK